MYFWMKKQQIEGLEFKSSATELSLGVELELQVLDAESLLLTPKAADIIAQCDDSRIIEEFFQSTVEIVSGIGKNVQDIQNDLQPSIFKAIAKANLLNLRLGSTGTHPLANYRERLVTPSERYHDLIDRNQWLIRRMAVYGMHIHLGMPSGDACIRYNFFFLNFLPHILALSASSPFWQGLYTGLSSCRPTTLEALPTAGIPYLVKSWKEFQSLYSFLRKSKAVNSPKDLWWDLRPSPHHGTLELRFCDEPATLKEAFAIVSFVHALGHWFKDHEDEWNYTHNPLKHWIIRENKWRAIRYGLHGQIVVSRTGKTKLIYKDILEWMVTLAPYVKELNYSEHFNTIKDIIEKGNSSERQYKVFESSQDLREVIRYNLKEFESGQPQWS
jgi:carboxylate-amine ligase